MKVAVVAEVRDGASVRYVRLGAQFCVRNADAAVESLQQENFKARRSDSMVLS